MLIMSKLTMSNTLAVLSLEMVASSVPLWFTEMPCMLPRCARKCFTNSSTLVGVFLQNLTWPSQLAVMTKPVLSAVATKVTTSRCMKLFS